MSFLSWNKSKKSTELVPIDNQSKDQEEIVVYKGNKNDITVRQDRRTMVKVRSKSVKIDGKVYEIDPKELIRMIKQVTQTIGEYKNRDNPYASYVIGALRKARNDMVSDLEHHFKINWEIDEETGKSVFYL